jgi:hypothetical protein
MLITFRAPDFAQTKVETPDPSSTTSDGLFFLTVSEIRSKRSGDAAQLRVAGIGDLN